MIQRNEQECSETPKWPTKEFLANELRAVLARYEWMEWLSLAA